ncbi:MAG: response regulator transcription factor [Planctomycetaceae bacterium]|nr:response regulator transcription factor [Planctomycetaceae bacterium]
MSIVTRLDTPLRPMRLQEISTQSVLCCLNLLDCLTKGISQYLPEIDVREGTAGLDLPELHASAGQPVLAMFNPESNPAIIKSTAENLHRHQIPFLMISKSFKPAWLSWAIQYGCRGCLSKFTPIHTLCTQISELFEHPQTYYWCPQAAEWLKQVKGRWQLTGNNVRNLLTPRQFEVFLHLADGYSMKETARLMNLTEKSVDCHKYRLMKRLRLHDRVQLCKLAIREGWIEA